MASNVLKKNDDYSSIDLDDAINLTLSIRKRIITSLLNEDFKKEYIFELKDVLERVRHLMIKSQKKSITDNSENLEKLTAKLESERKTNKDIGKDLERSLRILDSCYELLIEKFPDMRAKIKHIYQS
ncbi:hypothetical protein PCO87_14395 [Pectobacteriaceae bacterium C52]|nr:hypothetical protein PCO87_14395 [Pectobacteriaceae bacterium C52]